MKNTDLEDMEIQDELGKSFNPFTFDKKDSPKVSRLKKSLSEMRSKWTEIIIEHDESFKDIKKISNTRIISDRQRLIEETLTIQDHVEKTLRQLKQEKKQCYDNNTGKFKSYQAIYLQIDGLVAETEQFYNLLVNHIKFLNETLKSLDHLIYQIKNKIKFDELL